MPNQPMAEVFGFQIDDLSPEAQRHRRHHLCPFNNSVPSCTKDKASDPLGVCSVYSGNSVTITCPIRFRQGWRIASDAAEFFFPAGTSWTSFTEIRLHDAHGKSAGNIDVVLAAYDEEDTLLDFGALEVQAVNIGGILHAWHRKMAVAVDLAFFAQLPALPEVEPQEADVAWLVYDLIENAQSGRYELTRVRTVYTQFTAALLRITNPEPGQEVTFLQMLQRKLAERRRLEKQKSATDSSVLADDDGLADDGGMVDGGMVVDED